MGHIFWSSATERSKMDRVLGISATERPKMDRVLGISVTERSKMDRVLGISVTERSKIERVWVPSAMESTKWVTFFFYAVWGPQNGLSKGCMHKSVRDKKIQKRGCKTNCPRA